MSSPVAHAIPRDSGETRETAAVAPTTGIAAPRPSTIARTVRSTTDSLRRRYTDRVRRGDDAYDHGHRDARQEPWQHGPAKAKHDRIPCAAVALDYSSLRGLSMGSRPRGVHQI